MISDDRKNLYEALIRAYSVDRLKEIAAEIINAYREKNSEVLLRYARRLDLHRPSNTGHIFQKLIRHYHPDKLKTILTYIDDSFQRRDEKALRFYARAIGLPGYEPAPITEEANVPDLFAAEFYQEFFRESEYGYGVEDFDQVFDTREDFFTHFPDEDEGDFYDEYEDLEGSSKAENDFDEDLERRHETGEFGFLDALEEDMLGNLADEELRVRPTDLMNFDEISLAGRDIEVLDGIQYCRNLSVLDLSQNEISSISLLSGLHNLTVLNMSQNEIHNIDALAGLGNLISLDLSSNDISDINPLSSLDKLIILDLSANRITDLTPLLKLDNLKTVLLTGNRIKNRMEIEKLREGGVEVIFE